MRSCALFVFAVVLLVGCFACLASGDANFTLYQDSSCTQPVGEPQQIPFSSSTKCQTVPDQAISFVFYCAPDGSNTNFTFTVWNTTTDCSGDSLLSITSDAAAGSCAVTTITSQGQQFSVYSQIQCGTNTSQAERDVSLLEKDDAEDVIEDLLEDVEELVEMRRDLLRANRKQRVKPRQNSIISLLMGRD